MTHQEMADYLAEKLLGWRCGRDPKYPHPSNEEWWWAGEIGMEKSLAVVGVWHWHPQDDIGQCFEHIIPAMTKELWMFEFSLWRGSSEDERAVSTQARVRSSKTGNSYIAKGHNLETAIVEATYQAVKASEK